LLLSGRREADGFLWRAGRRLHERLQDIEHHLKVPIVFLLHGSEPLGKLLVSLKDLPELLVSWDGLRMLSVKEIGAKKACTIGRRGTYKDYVDLHFVVAEHHASLKDIISMAEKKFGGEFNSRLYAFHGRSGPPSRFFENA
jgi:hypothetical protein